jgi:xylitol oxidase
VFTVPGAEVMRRYPRAADFAALCAALDPERRFVNAFLDRLGL